ncbi:probable cytochrome P450 6a23 [Scaptodrosophila lebanonensis]|uniref:Probable cytochrome P450 6a23 n=1 Tax=Drosophila lebanonensis TaxID=7225 RepID=A0A6J2UKZ8_DROLE|nr:probable cytochrome P450 6a23 [Scaptodrosophila lebanonensis]
MLDIIALALIGLSIGFWYVRTSLNYWASRGIAHVEPQFPVGNMEGLRQSKHFLEILTPLYECFKGTGAPFAGLYMMLRPVVLVLDVELAKNILIKDFANFEDRGMYHNERDDPLTGHLFRIDGPKWRPLRHKMSPTFTSGKMKYMFDTVCAVGEELTRACAEQALNANNGILEISDLVARYTSDVIGSCAFGLECNGLRNPQAEFAAMGRRAFTDRRHNKLVDGFIETFPNLARRLRMRQIHQDITDFYMRIVKDTVKEREARGIVRQDFMNLLIEMKQRGELTIEELAAQAFIFFVAGFDTSANTLSFALYELAKQPRLQDKLRQEIAQALERHNGQFTYDSMQDLQYMELVIAETLRKYPILPHLSRISRQYYAANNDRHYYIEPGQMVIIPVYAIHHDPMFYPDPDKFIPERFLADQLAQRPTASWLPFGDGPRNCLGMRFGKMQTCSALFHLLRRFRFSTCPRTETTIQFVKSNILLCPANGIYLKIEALKARAMYLFISLVAVVIGLLIYVVNHHFNYWQRRGIPHEAPSFPHGNFGDWPKKRQFSVIFKDYYLKFKNDSSYFAGFFVFFKKSAVITDLELIKKVLIKDFNTFENRGIFSNEVDDPLSATLFSLEGQKWRHLRHKLSPTFTSGKMKFMFPTVAKVGEELANILREKMGTSSSQELEVTDLVSRFTADVIGSCAFGLECNSLQDPSAEFVQIGKRALTERRFWGLFDFFIFGLPQLARRLRLKVTMPDVEDFYFRIIRDTINHRVKNDVKRNDFMGIMIEMYKKYQDGNEEDGLSFNELAAQAFIFFLAGFETSSTTMGYALYELAQHQDIQDKLRDEVNLIMAKHNEDLNYEAMKQMQYLERVVMETLRKYPVLGHLTRKAKADYDVGDSKHIIEKGTGICISVLGLHHDPDIYPEPEKFDPERFTEQSIASRPACTWLPFGDGPRSCIGSRFGMMQTCIGLAYLVKDYRFTLAPGTKVPPTFVKKSFLLSPENGIVLNVETVS